MVDHGSSLVAVSRQHACDARTTIQDFEDLNTLVENQINQSIKNMRIDRAPGHTAKPRVGGQIAKAFSCSMPHRMAMERLVVRRRA